MSAFKLSIPKPCPQNWDKMIPEKGGRYCSSCDKVVLDFTKMGDEELLQYFSKNRNSEICGLVSAKHTDTSHNKITQYFIKLTNRIEAIKIRPVRNFSLFLLAFSMTITGCKTFYGTWLGGIIFHNHGNNKDAHNNVRFIPTEQNGHSKDSIPKSK